MKLSFITETYDLFYSKFRAQTKHNIAWHIFDRINNISLVVFQPKFALIQRHDMIMYSISRFTLHIFLILCALNLIVFQQCRKIVDFVVSCHSSSHQGSLNSRNILKHTPSWWIASRKNGFIHTGTQRNACWQAPQRSQTFHGQVLSWKSAQGIPHIYN